MYYLAHILHKSRTYLAHISHISNFYHIFQNRITTSLKSCGMLLHMFKKPFRYICIISHTSHAYLAHIAYISRTYLAHISHISCTHLAHISHISNFYYMFQNRISTSLKFLSFLECFYTCLESLLRTYVLCRTHLAHSKFLLCIPRSNFYPLAHI